MLGLLALLSQVRLFLYVFFRVALRFVRIFPKVARVVLLFDGLELFEV